MKFKRKPYHLCSKITNTTLKNILQFVPGWAIFIIDRLGYIGIAPGEENITTE